jgi:hypothetical protein
MALVTIKVLVAHAPRNSWSTVWPLLQDDDDFARRIFSRSAGGTLFRQMDSRAWPEGELAGLHGRMEPLFPRKHDLVHESGRAHFVGPREQVAHLRDSMLSQLIGRGTSAAVSTLKWIILQLRAGVRAGDTQRPKATHWL